MLAFGVLGAAAITPRALIYPCVDEPKAHIRAIAARDKNRASVVADWARIPDVEDDYQAVIDPHYGASRMDSQSTSGWETCSVRKIFGGE